MKLEIDFFDKNDLERQIQDLFGIHNAVISTKVLDGVVECFRALDKAGNKIQAIKVVRMLTGWSLRDTMQFVNARFGERVQGT